MNPHGFCESCAWHSHETQRDYDGDTWHRWTCWRTSGNPEIRLQTTTAMQPPACECHLKARSADD